MFHNPFDVSGNAFPSVSVNVSTVMYPMSYDVSPVSTKFAVIWFAANCSTVCPAGNDVISNKSRENNAEISSHVI